MKILFSLVFCLLFLTSYSQKDYTPVNRDEVEKAVKDSSSPSYYPTLLKRFEAFDTTLYLEDYRLLYYGFVFQDAYIGYNVTSTREIKDLINKKDFKEAIKLCKADLEKVPVSLTANYLMGLALYMQDKNDSTRFQYMDRYRYLTGAILSSGDGLSCETAFKTIFVPDEYEVIYVQFEVKKSMGQALKFPCDELSIEPSESFNHDKIYFNTSETFLGMEKSMNKSK